MQYQRQINRTVPLLSLVCLFLPLGKFPGEPINIVYVPSHLFHMLFELFKVCQYVVSSFNFLSRTFNIIL